MKVSTVISSNGNTIANQIIIRGGYKKKDILADIKTGDIKLADLNGGR